MPIPTEKDIIEFVSKGKLVNYSRIARKFHIKKLAVPDIIEPLIRRKIIVIEKVGSNKFVRFKK